MCGQVFMWAHFQTNKPEVCADFPDKLFLFVAWDISQLPSEPAIQLQGKFSLGENKDSSTHFFVVLFLIASISISGVFFLKILHFAGVALWTLFHHRLSYHLKQLKSRKCCFGRGVNTGALEQLPLG